jgi:hypothetical protein
VALINIHGFEIQYDASKYVNYVSGRGITDGLKLHVCLAPDATIECGEALAEYKFNIVRF